MAFVPDPLNISPAISHFLSPLLVGTMPTCFLYGIMLGQSIWYFRHCTDDSTTSRMLVLLVLLLDGVQTAGLAQSALTMYLRNPLDLKIPTGILIDLNSTSVVVLFVHCAFVHRVWLMSYKRRYITVFLGVLVLSRFSVSMALNVTIAFEKTAFELHNTFSNAFGVAEFAIATLCDILIAIAMATYLNRERSERSWLSYRTNMLISKLVTFFIGIGALTSIFALVITILWITMPQNMVFVIFHSVLSKLYGNSLLVILNLRRQI